MSRIRTHHGRKIKHVHRGHVVDVATSIAIEIDEGRGGFSLRIPGRSGLHQSGAGPYTEKALVERLAAGIYVCTFVRALVEIAAFQEHEVTP